VTVDGFLRENSIENVTLVKIDVEAAEMDVLLGAQEALAQRRIEQLIVEVHFPTVKWDHIAGLLKRYGYEVSDISGGEMHAFRSPKANTKLTVIDREPVGVVLIGCGAVAEQHYSVALDALANEGLAETLAIVDPQEERRVQLLEYFSTARTFPDIKAMLAETRPELAIIAAPHRYHSELAVQCLNQGIHVLCEKPMAITTDECDRMIEAAKAADRVLAVGHFRRFYPSCETIKNLLDSRCLGQVKSFQFLEGYQYNWPLKSASVFDKASAGGGVFIDTGAHALDLILWWLGDVLDVAYQDDAMGGVEANCELRLRMVHGAQGIVRLSRDWPLPNYCLIECEKGWLKYSCDVTDRITWGLYGANYSLNTEIQRAVPYQENDIYVSAQPNPLLNYFTAQLRNVVQAIRGGEQVRVPGTDARKTIALIEKCYETRELLSMEWLDKAEAGRASLLANVQ
jgi:predicted dehydrogenase